MITHRATLDVSTSLLRTVSGLLARARRGPGRRPRQRAAGVHSQALLVLRYLRDGPRIWRLARDAGISRASGYRYLHEALSGTCLCLDGTLVPIDRVDVRKPDGRHLFHSGKHKQFGAIVQVIATPAGDVIWVSPGSPGSLHDTRAAREHVLDDLAPYISRHHRRDGTVRLDVLADKGYTGADVGISTPAKRRCGVTPHVDEVTRNQLLVGTRAVAERANAQLSMRWRALQRVTLDPAAVTVIAAAALVLTLFEREHGRD